MTPTQIARRADALYADGSCGITRRVLCDMVAQRESDIEQERSDNARLRELVAELYQCSRQYGCDRCGYKDGCAMFDRMAQMGVEVTP